MKKKLLVLGLLLVAALSGVLAQEYRGNVFVKVVGPDGQPVVGAVVSLVGADTTRNLTTGAKGEVQFMRVDPGNYSMKITYPDYAPESYKLIEVNAGANVQFTAKLTKTITEEVTVTSRSPLLDRRKTGSSTALTATELTEVPQTRDPWSIVTTIPGLNVDRLSVGGSQAGQQSNFGGKGDIGNNNQWTIDGVSMTDVSAVGGSMGYYDFNTFAEINVSTGGVDFEMTTPGINMNFIGKQGANRVSGSMRLVRGTSGLSKDNRSSEVKDQIAAGTPVKTASQVDQIFEKSFDIGGPIVKDQVWWYVGFGRNDINLIVPDPIQGSKTDATQLTNWNAKVHGANFGSKLVWKAFYQNGEKTKQGRSGGWDAYSDVKNTPQNLLWNQTGPTKAYSGDVGFFITPNIELSLQYTDMKSNFDLIPPLPSAQTDPVHIEGGTLSGSNYLIETSRPNKQATLRGNAFVSTGSWDHELKFGYRYKKFDQQSLTRYSGTGVAQYVDAGYVYLYTPLVSDFTYKYDTLWIGDTVTHGGLTLVGGLTWFRQKATWNAATQDSVSLYDPNGVAFYTVPGVSYTGGDGPEFKDLLPRLAVTYTIPVGSKRLLLRGSYAKFVDQGGGGNMNVGYQPGTTTEAGFAWTDGGCEGHPEYQNDGVVEQCEIAATPDFLNQGTTTTFDSRLSAPKVNEFVIGAEYELLPDFTLAANVTYRRRYNTIWPSVNSDYYMAGITTADYQQRGTATPVLDGVQYNLPYYTIEYPDGVTRLSVEANRPGYYERYQGLELLATKRLSNKWSLRGYLAFNDWKKYYSESSIQNPTVLVLDNPVDGGTVSGNGGTRSGNFADVFNGSEKWAANANFIYQLPLDITLGANLFSRQGFVNPAYYRQRVSDSDGHSNTYLLQIGKGDQRRLPTLTDLDLRIAKGFKLNETHVEVSLEAFNVFNSSTVLQRSRRINPASGATPFDAVNEYMAGRLIRFGAVVDF